MTDALALNAWARVGIVRQHLVQTRSGKIVLPPNNFMFELLNPPIASASVEGRSKWQWQLRIDELGLYRWYLDGVAETNIRGGTRDNAEYALRRFVGHSLNGDLKITESPEQLAVLHRYSILENHPK